MPWVGAPGLPPLLTLLQDRRNCKKSRCFRTAVSGRVIDRGKSRGADPAQAEQS